MRPRLLLTPRAFTATLVSGATEQAPTYPASNLRLPLPRRSWRSGTVYATERVVLDFGASLTITSLIVALANCGGVQLHTVAGTTYGSPVLVASHVFSRDGRVGRWRGWIDFTATTRYLGLTPMRGSGYYEIGGILAGTATDVVRMSDDLAELPHVVAQGATRTELPTQHTAVTPEGPLHLQELQLRHDVHRPAAAWLDALLARGGAVIGVHEYGAGEHTERAWLARVVSPWTGERRTAVLRTSNITLREVI